jgi:uncharacterized protein YjdB
MTDEKKEQIEAYHKGKAGIMLGVYAVRSTVEKAKEMLGEDNIHVVEDGTIYYLDEKQRHLNPDRSKRV